MTQPYTYLIGWTNHKIYYYGVRYAKGCHPNDLWTKYRTSSSHVLDFYRQHGEPDVIQVRKIFSNTRDARLWEHKVLRRIKAVKRADFLNKTDNISFDPIVISKYMRGKSQTTGYTNEYRIANGMKPLSGKPRGAKHSEKAKKERSERLKNKPVPINFKKPKGSKCSPEAIEVFKRIAKNRPYFHCETCNKSIKGKMNWDRHLKSKKHLSQISIICSPNV